MFFTHLIVMRFTEPFQLTANELEERLKARPFRDVTSLEMSSAGWFPPTGNENHTLVHAVNGRMMICLQVQTKILPAAVINEVLAERLEAYEEQAGHPAGRQRRAEMRDEVTQDLLPKAFSQTRKHFAYIDVRGGHLVINAASPGTADVLTSILRQCLGSLPIEPFGTVRERPYQVMTQWLQTNEVPVGIVIDDGCRMKSREDSGSEIVMRKANLASDEVRRHLESGMDVHELDITFKDRLNFRLTSDLFIKRLHFLDLVQQEAADTEAETAEARFDADFAIMSGELAEFLPALVAMFGGALETRL